MAVLALLAIVAVFVALSLLSLIYCEVYEINTNLEKLLERKNGPV